MKSHVLRLSFTAAFILGILMLVMLGVAQAKPAQQSDEDLVAKGKYLATVANCFSCHTPYQEKYADLTSLNLDDLKTLSLREHDSLDESRAFSGGRPFDLGPQGVIFSRNLTPDPETGLGDWTDDEIKTAIRLGISRDGHQLYPLMPYLTFNHMADEDLDAIVAYLRSLEPIKNEVPPSTLFIPPLNLTLPEEPVVSPDPTDYAARGAYLLTGVIACSDCHTPFDLETGAPRMEMFLAGGQPYEGPWGIVYGGNITSDEKTGIGKWTDEQIFRAIVAGVRIDGRRLILMPWQDYANLSADDLQSIVTFLKEGVPLVENEVPTAAVNPDFIETIDQ